MTEKVTRRYKVFLDFDGTITNIDVGEELFVRFTDREKAYAIVKRWLNGEITSIQTWEMLCIMLDNINIELINEFIDSVEIDFYLQSFLSFCKQNEIDIFVLSDGFDYYINRILKKYQLQYLPTFSNIAKFEGNSCKPQFPFRDENCQKCANCKRNHIINNSGDEDYTIYVGDGFSDVCPVEFCDYVFAKKTLLRYCETYRISYFPYKNFNDVQRKLEELVNKKNLKKRHQAFLKRKEVYEQG